MGNGGFRKKQVDDNLGKNGDKGWVVKPLHLFRYDHMTMVAEN